MSMKRREFLKGLAVGGAAVAAGACHGDVAPAGTVRVSHDVPVLGDYDVCVVGAGPGGVGAAIAAARAGKLCRPALGDFNTGIESWLNLGGQIYPDGRRYVAKVVYKASPNPSGWDERLYETADEEEDGEDDA